MRNLYFAADASHRGLKNQLLSHTLTSQFTLQDLDQLLYLDLTDVEEYARIIGHLLVSDTFGQAILMTEHARAYAETFNQPGRVGAALVINQVQVILPGQARILCFQGNRFAALESAVELLFLGSGGYAVFDRNLQHAYA